MSINEIFNMYFGIIEDERDQYTIKHRLIDILKLVMLAILSSLEMITRFLL